MITEYIQKTKEATFSIELPHPTKKLPVPTGTGFFVSPDGWFVTAAHVVTENGQPNGKVRGDIASAFLQKETYYNDEGKLQMGGMCPGNEGLDFIDPNFDFALIKVDFEKNKMREGFKNRDGFPYLQMSSRSLIEGESVYSFGYPLSQNKIHENGGMIVGETSLSPRTTSAIVSSLIDATQTVQTPNMPKVYVLDKALNYGNSGGPILSAEDGKVYALCSRFQPFFIPQGHLTQPGKPTVQIMSPSLYGIVSRLNNKRILDELQKRGIQIDK
jgi:S1-C subfamily serine protease